MEHKSLIGEEFKGKEKRILVQSTSETYKYGRELGLCREDGGMKYKNMQFHLFDLQEDMPRQCLTPLIMYTWGFMVPLDNSVYIFGGINPEIKKSDEFKLLQSLAPESYQLFYMGGARVDFDPDQSQEGVWGSAPNPIKDRICSNCVTLLGKIYTFGSYLAPEVLDPTVGHWQQIRSLPPEIIDCEVSYHPLPDPTNHRIFVHLSHGQLSPPSLYTFKPDSDVEERWKCVHTSFHCWTNVSILLEGVIYFHSYRFPSLLQAFDVASGEWLDVSWDSSFENDVDMNNEEIDFDALISLGDGILCFTGWTPIYPSDRTGFNRAKIPFYKFRVERCGDTVSLVPLSFRSYELPATDEVVRFLPV